MKSLWMLATALTVALPLAACSPSLNWRDARPAGTALLLTFPCKPQQVSQDVVLAGRGVRMSMTGCVASGMTFALAHADLGDAAAAGAALDALRRAALDNVAGTASRVHPAAIEHATTGLASAQDLIVDGRTPQGEAMRERIVLFAQGSRVFQATTLATAQDFQSDAADTFAASIRLPTQP